MNNPPEYPQGGSVNKIKIDEKLGIENYPTIQLTNLQKEIIVHNRDKADKSLRELEVTLNIPEKIINNIENKGSEELGETIHNSSLHTITPFKTVSSIEETSHHITIAPNGIQGAAQGTKESVLLIGRSTKKFLTDFVLLPYDIYNYFKKSSKKIG